MEFVMSLAHRQDGNLEYPVATVLSSQDEDPTTTIVPQTANADAAEQQSPTAQQPSDGEIEAQGEKWNKYIYPEFYGHGGRRYLVDILNAILPLSQVKTWEAADDCGPECYAKADEIAKKRNRNPRTVERDLFTMYKHRLLSYEPVMRMLRARDGSGTSKFRSVLLINFSGMLALAHEYHLWRLSDDYIPPERERLAAIIEDEALCGKLLRFDCYRRILCTAPRGRKPSYSPQDDLYNMYDGQGMPKIQNSTLLSKTLSKILSSESTNTERRILKEEIHTNSKAEEGTDFYPPRTIRTTEYLSEMQQVRIPSQPTINAETRSEIAPDTVRSQGNGLRPAPAKHVNDNMTSEKRWSTAEKVAAATGILVEHQRELRGGQHKRPSELPLPEPLARVCADLSQAFHDENPASSQTDLARLYLRARVASGETLSPEEFYAQHMAKPCQRVSRMLQKGTIRVTRLVTNPDTGEDEEIPNGMPLFMRWIRLDVAKAEKRARKQREQEADTAYLARRYRESQRAQSVQENVPAPSSSGEDDEQGQPDTSAPNEPGEQPVVSHQAASEQPMASETEDALEAKLEEDCHHPNPATRRSARRRLHARKHLPRLEALGVPAPIEQLHHCFCPFHYAPATPGAEPRCISCDADPGWPAEVAEIVEAVKAYRGD
jgi:hypothetical protein